MNELITYGIVGILALVVLFLVLCVVVVILKVITTGVDVEEETNMK